MRGNEFVQRAYGAPIAGRGHGLLRLGERRTVVRNSKDELKTGTYHAMLKQLGLTEKDIF